MVGFRFLPPVPDRYDRTPSLTYSDGTSSASDPAPSPPHSPINYKFPSLVPEPLKPRRKFTLSPQSSNQSKFYPLVPEPLKPRRQHSLPPQSSVQFKISPLVPEPLKPRRHLRIRHQSNGSRGSLSSFLPDFTRSPLLAVITNPVALAHFLRHVDWHAFFALSQTCREARQLLRNRQLKDMILAHFVPEYLYALRERTLHKLQDITVSFHDLNLFSE
jgi:hypothetical protein